MDKVLAVLAILATIHVGVQGQVLAESPPGWQQASRAPARTPVRVTLRDGTVVSGLLGEIQPDQLVMTDHTLERGRLTGDLSKPYTFPRTEITKVEVRQPRARNAKRTTLMVLAAAGAVIGAIALIWVARCASEQSRCGA